MRHRAYPLLLLLSFASIAVRATMTIEVMATPQLTPLLDDLYIAGNFNNWTPGDPGSVLTINTSGHPVIEVSGAAGETLEFKFTRGSWAMVEGNPSGGYIPNRTVVYTDGSTLQVTIEGWEDLPGIHTISPRVFLLDTDFAMPELGRIRRIWIYLPQGYEETQDTYPVWYMHDGQNLFSAATSFAGEWQIDESLEGAVTSPCRSIIVGIDNGGADRADEYAPWFNTQHNAGGEGAAYASFVVNTLKPFIDEEFRTRPERIYTCTAGSSLGALIAAYMILEHSEVFSTAALFSPAFWFNHANIMALAQSQPLPADSKIWMSAGTAESSTMVPYMNEMRGHLLDGGLSPDQVLAIAEPGGSHSEWWWAEVFPAAFDFLISCAPLGFSARDGAPVWRVYPNPAADSLQVEWTGLEVSGIHVYDAAGTQVLTSGQIIPAGRFQLNIAGLSPGLYHAVLAYHTPAGLRHTTHSFVKIQAP